jgi:hypothetical protein
MERGLDDLPLLLSSSTPTDGVAFEDGEGNQDRLRRMKERRKEGRGTADGMLRESEEVDHVQTVDDGLRSMRLKVGLMTTSSWLLIGLDRSREGFSHGIPSPARSCSRPVSSSSRPSSGGVESRDASVFRHRLGRGGVS